MAKTRKPSILKPFYAPAQTGVYRFLDRNNKTLYVGKAINIRSRLRSHFADPDTVNPAKAQLLRQTRDITWELCASEPEALIREAELIKKLKPRFNILLRDDKNYFYVAFTKEPFPKVFLTHQPTTFTTNNLYNQQPEMLKEFRRRVRKGRQSSVAYVGPFTDGNALKRTLKMLRRIFPYCICRTPHDRECLAATLGRCVGICCLKSTSLSFPRKRKSVSLAKAQYRKNIKSIQAVLQGERPRLMSSLKKDMRQASSKQRFEEAGRLRDQIGALQEIFSHRAVVANGEILRERATALRQIQKFLKLEQVPRRIEMYDMSNNHGTSAVGSLVVFFDGIPEKSQYRKFRIRTITGIDDVAMMQEVIHRRLGHDEWPKPDILIVDGGKGQMGAVLEALKITNHKLQKSQTLPFALLGLAKGKDELHYIPFPYEIRDTKYEIQTTPRSRLPRPVRHLFDHLQAEAHRFAITYHRNLRSRNARK
ncbi:MAG: GIY-YIG nuclease family protein [bacterium]|nr:GIY-YIG nuclease family protein [bacterium]